MRRRILDCDFSGAARGLEALCPALAANQWLQFQLKRHNFLLLAARATAPGGGSEGEGEAGREARARQLQQALGVCSRAERLGRPHFCALQTTA